MKNWRTDKAMYHFTEISRSKKEEYDMIMTGEEVGAWCKMKNEAYGYIPGCGGDRSYQCIAVFVDFIEETEPEEIPGEELESAIAAEAAEEIKEERKSEIEIIDSLGLTGKTWWRFYRNYLTGLACCMEPGTIEYNNIVCRADWIANNRI